MSVNIHKAMATSDYDCAERRHELMWLAEHARNAKEVVEVGSWKGTTAIAMADNTAGTVYAVDSFNGSIGEEATQKVHEGEEDWLYKTFKANTANFPNIVTMRMESIEAACYFASLAKQFDFVFLDASHDYDSVKKDIQFWKPLVAPGGILAGHDRTWDGVSKAIN